VAEGACAQWLRRKRWGNGVRTACNHNEGESQGSQSNYDHDPDEHEMSVSLLEISMPIEISHFKMILF